MRLIKKNLNFNKHIDMVSNVEKCFIAEPSPDRNG